MIAWIVANWQLLGTLFWVVSEMLNEIPSVKSNTFLELVLSSLDSLFAKAAVTPPAPPPVNIVLDTKLKK